MVSGHGFQLVSRKTLKSVKSKNPTLCTVWRTGCSQNGCNSCSVPSPGLLSYHILPTYKSSISVPCSCSPCPLAHPMAKRDVKRGRRLAGLGSSPTRGAVLTVEEEPLLLDASDGDPPSDNAAGHSPPASYVPRRYITAVLLFFGLSMVYALRVCISIAAVPGVAANNATLAGAGRNATVTMYSEFGWTNTEQGIVLGAFFNGYIFTQILGGVLSQRFGGKLVILGSVFLASVLSILTPLAASYSFPALVVLPPPAALLVLPMRCGMSIITFDAPCTPPAAWPSHAVPWHLMCRPAELCWALWKALASPPSCISCRNGPRLRSARLRPRLCSLDRIWAT
jgi:hypothetical protein